MINRAITYIVVVLIAMQSVVAVADIHQYHQTGSEHLTFEHSHEHNESSSLSAQTVASIDITDSSVFDCHHCCHCHGVIHLFLGSGQNSSLSIKIAAEFFDYQISYSSFRTPPDNPPPIYLS